MDFKLIAKIILSERNVILCWDWKIHNHSIEYPPFKAGMISNEELELLIYESNTEYLPLDTFGLRIKPHNNVYDLIYDKLEDMGKNEDEYKILKQISVTEEIAIDLLSFYIEQMYNKEIYRKIIRMNITRRSDNFDKIIDVPKFINDLLRLMGQFV